MQVLGIESSCDETGVALVSSEHGLLANLVHSQIDLHADYGGVVPELASRDHVRRLLPMVQQLMENCAIAKPDAVAFTSGPGLIGALMVGALTARALAWGWRVPALGIHHLEAHLLAPMLEGSGVRTPYLALLVSGGHTLIAKVETPGKYLILGQSLDDAAGEAFDKTAKLLGLDYPGGPALAALARSGTAGRFRFPRPMMDRPGLDMSFSGLKTHALQVIEQHGTDAQSRADIALAFEEAVVETLCIKCERACAQTGIRQLIVAGGVGANRSLRAKLHQSLNAIGGAVHFPSLELCTDNGAMIAYAGLLRIQSGETSDLSVDVRARWPLDELPGFEFA